MWFITVLEKQEKHPLGYINHGCLRTWGYYHDHDRALQALHENWTDMWEGCYHYAVLEEIGEGIFMSGRSVSGSMRKLVTDGYVEKVGTNPVCYGLTDTGRDYQFDKM